MSILTQPVHNNSEMDTLFKWQDTSHKPQANQPELQQRFLELVAAEARQAITKNDIQPREFKTAQSQLKQVKQQLDEALATITARDQTIEVQAATLAATASLKDQQQEELSDLKKRLRELRQGFKELRTEKEQLDSTLAATIDEANEYKERARSLEITLQTETQKINGLEDSLIHSQELTAAAQLRLEELEKEKEDWQKQQEEYADTTNELRENNTRLESEWRQTLSELGDLRNRTPDDTVTKLQSSLANAQEKIGALNNVIVETKAMTADSTEQLLWYEANLRTVEKSLEQNRQNASQQKAQLAELNDELAKKETAVAQMASHIQTPLKKGQFHRKGAENAKFSLWESLNLCALRAFAVSFFSRLILQAQEQQTDKNSQKIDDQEKKLAELQATLIKRKKELKHTRNKITWHLTTSNVPNA